VRVDKGETTNITKDDLEKEKAKLLIKHRGQDKVL
jgi:hypothetical protein